MSEQGNLENRIRDLGYDLQFNDKGIQAGWREMHIVALRRADGATIEALYSTDPVLQREPDHSFILAAVLAEIEKKASAA